jgi:DNA-binding NarL/FixJ family response regulator
LIGKVQQNSSGYTVDKPNHIIVIANPGHFRDSLAAVLMTLPSAKLFLMSQLDHDDLGIAPNGRYSLVLADLVGPDQDGAECLDAVKKRCPGIRSLALVDNLSQSRIARESGAEYVLPRSASAGELLSAVRRINAQSFQPPILGDPTRVLTLS